MKDKRFPTRAAMIKRFIVITKDMYLLQNDKISFTSPTSKIKTPRYSPMILKRSANIVFFIGAERVALAYSQTFQIQDIAAKGLLPDFFQYKFCF